MIPRTMVLLVCLSRFAPAQAPACQVLESGRVLGKHLAAALPAFAVLPPELVVAAMPPPGGTRTLHATELASLAQRYSAKLGPPTDICFIWAMEQLDRTRVLEAMETVFPNTGAHIEIVEMTLTAVPHGRLEFNRERLVAPSGDQHGPVLWPGEVVYAENQHYPVWARVKIAAPCTRLVATEPLRSGQPIRAEQIKTVSASCFPSPDNAALSPDSLVGQVLSRMIPAGGEIRAAWVTSPNDVNRGDTVEIEVHSGAARLAFTGKAEASGRAGDLIAIRNPTSNRIFQGRVSGKGKATVQADGVKVN